MSTFKFSAAVNADKVFLIQRSAIDGRLDPLYYFSVNNLAIVKQTIYPVRRLSSVIEMTRGRFGHRPRNDPRFYGGQYPFIQTGDVVRASKSHGNITFSQTLNEQGLKTSRLFDKRVVVLTIAANIGDTAILDYPACFPDSLIGLQPKTDEMTLEYINVYFKFIRQYLNDLAPQAAQKNINYQQLAPIPIVVPPLTVQNQAVALYEAALRAQQQKYQQATDLLSGIDAYLLGELGITLPEQDKRLEKRMFYVNSREVTGGRFDPQFYQVDVQLMCEQLKMRSHAHLKQLIEFSNEAWNQHDYFDEVFPYIEISEIDLTKGTIENLSQVDIVDAPSRAKMVVRELDILVSLTRPTRGAIALNLHKGINIASTGFSVLRKLKTLDVDRTYLFYALRLSTSLWQMGQRCAGGNYPAITQDELGRILIPLLPIAKQKEIVTHIQSIRTQAQTLQQQAEQILADAKAQVERMILGGE
jgi:restriction endonuclease S subunit